MRPGNLNGSITTIRAAAWQMRTSSDPSRMVEAFAVPDYQAPHRNPLDDQEEKAASSQTADDLRGAAASPLLAPACPSFPVSIPAGLVQTPVGRCSDKRRAVWNQVEGYFAILIPCGRIGPGGEKRPDDGDGLRRIAVTGRPVQRGLATPPQCVGIGPAFDKRLDGLRMAFTDRVVQRGDAKPSIPCARIGPAFDKRPDGLRMAQFGRPVQRGLVTPRQCVGIGPAFDKRPDDLRMAFIGRLVQRGAASLVPRVRDRPRL